MHLARRIRQESYTVDYAGFWIRLLAFIIDALVLWGINWLVSSLWSMASGAGFWGGRVADPLLPDAAETSASWIVSFAIWFVIGVAYFVGFWGWRGQTPGKIIMRIKIVRFAGDDIGWGAAVMRYLGYIISVLLAFTGYLWVAFDGRRQGFHDKIADTFVIRLSDKRLARSGGGG